MIFQGLYWFDVLEIYIIVTKDYGKLYHSIFIVLNGPINWYEVFKKFH